MLAFNRKKGIETVSDFNEVASELFETFLQTLHEQGDYTYPRDEDDDSIYDEGVTFFWTNRGSKLAQRYLDRLYAVGAAHFPEDDANGHIDISSTYFQE